MNVTIKTYSTDEIFACIAFIRDCGCNFVSPHFPAPCPPPPPPPPFSTIQFAHAIPPAFIFLFIFINKPSLKINTTWNSELHLFSFVSNLRLGSSRGSTGALETIFRFKATRSVQLSTGFSPAGFPGVFQSDSLFLLLLLLILLLLIIIPLGEASRIGTWISRLRHIFPSEWLWGPGKLVPRAHVVVCWRFCFPATMSTVK